MYQPVTKETLEAFGAAGFIKLSERPDTCISTFNGCYQIHSRQNPALHKPLFNVTFQIKENAIIFSDVVYCHKEVDRHEYEKFLIMVLMKMEKSAKELGIQKVFVQSECPWIVEGFYERDFDIIDITAESDICIYSALKTLKEKHEDN